MSHTLRALAAVGTLAALTLSACGSDSDSVPAAETQGAEPIADNLERFYDQEISWQDCLQHADFECGVLEVPMDYDHPSDGSMSLALTRAADTASDIPVVFNPGGPGASGVSFVQEQLSFILSDHLAENISAVGFDPRGVGASEPVRCATGEESDASRETIIDASTPEGWEASQESMTEYGQQCLERSGEIVKFVDSISAAKDMDVLREALGESHLHFFGMSYGTKLGATYAELFPQNVGKFVLDSVLPPSAESFAVTKAQSAGFEQSLHAWADWCAATSDCRVGTPGDPDSVMTAVTEFLDSVEDEPLEYPNGRSQPLSDLFYGVVTPLYSQDSWAMLGFAFEQGIARDFDSPDVTPLFLAYADAYHGRQPDGEYSNNTDAFNAINCLDYAAGEKTLEQATQQAKELAEDAPLFGPFLSYSTGCNGWPVEPVEPLGPTVAEGSAPIVVTGLTSDPATPIHFSHELAQQLENSIHITVEGEGHGAYSRENPCIVESIDGYILDEQYPEDGLVCS